VAPAHARAADADKGTSRSSRRARPRHRAQRPRPGSVMRQVGHEAAFWSARPGSALSLIVTAGQARGQPSSNPCSKQSGSPQGCRGGSCVAWAGAGRQGLAYGSARTAPTCAVAASQRRFRNRSDQVGNRKPDGAAGGRPPTFCPQRHVVECGYNHLKGNWAVAIRFDKLAVRYVACLPSGELSSPSGSADRSQTASSQPVPHQMHRRAAWEHG
jgi:hypothetical protein